MRRLALLSLAFVVACSQETPAPETSQARTASETRSVAPPATPPSVSTVAISSVSESGTYDEAIRWLKTNPGFRFSLKEGDLATDGEMKRVRVGMEEVTFTADGTQWRGASGPRGLVWSAREGSTWKEKTGPDYAGRVFQRVTFAFDPQKKEGSAQLAGSDAHANLYRFTDANTGRVHEVRVRKSDNAIESIRIGTDVELTIH
jgi:hypothetical protein